MNPPAIACAVILALAVCSKLAGMPTSMLRAMADLRIPSRLMSARTAWAHLVTQVVIAAGLIATTGVVRVIIGGAGCFLVATYLYLVVSRIGSNCRCLSDTSSRIGAFTVLRNTIIVVLAVLAVPEQSLIGSSSVAWLVTVVLSVTVALCELVQRHRT